MFYNSFRLAIGLGEFTPTKQIDLDLPNSVTTTFEGSNPNIDFGSSYQGEDTAEWIVASAGGSFPFLVPEDLPKIKDREIKLTIDDKIEIGQLFATGEAFDNIPVIKAGPGGISLATIRGLIIWEIHQAVVSGLIRREVGLFLLSIVPTESSGGIWNYHNPGSRYYGAFQIFDEIILREPGLSLTEFLNNKTEQLRVAQKLYDEKKSIVNNEVLTGVLDGEGWTASDGKPVREHLQGKSELYQIAYAWLTLAGIDGNRTRSSDYAGAAEANASRINQVFAERGWNFGVEIYRRD